MAPDTIFTIVKYCMSTLFHKMFSRKAKTKTKTKKIATGGLADCLGTWVNE